MPGLRRKFAIDDELKRYSKALAHLVALKDFDEIKAYVVKHSLYVDALKLYQYDTTHLDQIMKLYADYLSSTNKHKEAGIGAFLSCPITTFSI